MNKIIFVATLSLNSTRFFSIALCKLPCLSCDAVDRPFSHSKKESESNDVLMPFAEFSNVHNSDGSSSDTQSNVLYKNV